MLPVLFSFGPIVIHSFGVVLVVAFLLSSFAFWQKAREENYDEEEVFDLILAGSFWALLGSRLFYILLHFDDFGLNLWYWVSVWSRPGFFWLGLVVGGLAFTVRYARQRRWDTFEILDLLVVGVSLGQALTHFGLFLSGAGVGRVTSLPWGMVFPGLFEKRHPVGLYGFVAWLLVFLLLWWLEGKYRRFDWYQKFKGDARPGFVAFSYLIVAGGVGLGLALLSEPEYVYLGVDMEAVTRAVLIVAGLLGIYMRSGAKFRFEWKSKIRAARKRKEDVGWHRRRKTPELE